MGVHLACSNLVNKLNIFQFFSAATATLGGFKGSVRCPGSLISCPTYVMGFPPVCST